MKASLNNLSGAFLLYNKENDSESLGGLGALLPSAGSASANYELSERHLRPVRASSTARPNISYGG